MAGTREVESDGDGLRLHAMHRSALPLARVVVLRSRHIVFLQPVQHVCLHLTASQEMCQPDGSPLESELTSEADTRKLRFISGRPASPAGQWTDVGGRRHGRAAAPQRRDMTNEIAKASACRNRLRLP